MEKAGKQGKERKDCSTESVGMVAREGVEGVPERAVLSGRPVFSGRSRLDVLQTRRVMQKECLCLCLCLCLEFTIRTAVPTVPASGAEHSQQGGSARQAGTKPEQGTF